MGFFKPERVINFDQKEIMLMSLQVNGLDCRLACTVTPYTLSLVHTVPLYMLSPGTHCPWVMPSPGTQCPMVNSPLVHTIPGTHCPLVHTAPAILLQVPWQYINCSYHYLSHGPCIWSLSPPREDEDEVDMCPACSESIRSQLQSAAASTAGGLRQTPPSPWMSPGL